jgi:riboflavin kinase/FMN adenylyltransferase
MAIFTHTLNDALPDACRGGTLAIGNFDGVHRGHQSLLAEAARHGRPAIAVTFDPHPIQLLRPDRVEPFLSTLDDRANLLQQYGADHVLILQTTPALLQLTAREFFERIIALGLQTKALVEGYSFSFGRGREGSIEVLKQLCAEKSIGLTLMQPCEVLGQPVSSSRVRRELQAGNVDVAQQLLGRPYRLTGVVGTGAKRGATLGFPTANLEQIVTLIPGNGVYAVRATIAPLAPSGRGVGGEATTWPAAANVGPNPTFGENARKIEVHLLGFQGDLYGHTLSVDFIKKIRETRAFRTPQELITQINADIADVTIALA